MAQQITIRPLNIKDGLAYQRLRLQALVKNPESFLSSYNFEKNKPITYFSNEILSNQADDLFCYWGYFDSNQQLLAYVLLAKSYWPKQQHLAFVYNFYTDCNHRRKGIAKQLFKYIFQQLKKQSAVERIFLSCNAGNKTAYQFYQAINFKRYAIKKKSLKINNQYDDEIEMVMIIK